MRAHNKVQKECSKLSDMRENRRHEKAFKSNPWHYSKQLLKENTSVNQMSCTTDEAYAYFSGIAKDDDYAGFPSWINMVINIPHGESLNEFDMSPITPRMIKNILKKRSSSSSSGEDGITHHHLKMLPSTHHFMATLFSKILLHSHTPPSSWCHAKVITIYKNGDPSNPANFRPIALTSVVAKLIHKIIAIRLEDFVLSNSIIDTSLQKGFLGGINGCMEQLSPSLHKLYRSKKCIWICGPLLHIRYAKLFTSSKGDSSIC